MIKESTVLANNSSNTALSGSATFTGSFDDVQGMPSLIVSMKTDTDCTLYVDFSVDGTNVDSTITYAVASGVNEVHRITVSKQYARVRVVNGSTPQSYMRLQTIAGSTTGISYRLNSSVQQDADCTNSRVIDMDVSIVTGFMDGYSFVNKFGRNPDVDTTTTPEDIWNGGGVYTGFPTGSAELVQVFSSDVNDTSAGTGARTIRITGLDANYAVQQETITLNGTTPVNSVNTYMRVHTATIITDGSGGVNVGQITCRHVTTTANVFFVMPAGGNQTNVASYTVPAGYTAYMRRLSGAIRGGTNAVVDGYIWTRSFGGVFRSRRPFTIGINSPLRDEISGGLVFTEKSDISVRIVTTSVNNVDVTASYDLMLVKN